MGYNSGIKKRMVIEDRDNSFEGIDDIVTETQTFFLPGRPCPSMPVFYCEPACDFVYTLKK